MVEDDAVDNEVEVDTAEHNIENTVKLTVNPEVEFISSNDDTITGIQGNRHSETHR